MYIYVYVYVYVLCKCSPADYNDDELYCHSTRWRKFWNTPNAKAMLGWWWRRRVREGCGVHSNDLCPWSEGEGTTVVVVKPICIHWQKAYPTHITISASLLLYEGGMGEWYNVIISISIDNLWDCIHNDQDIGKSTRIFWNHGRIPYSFNRSDKVNNSALPLYLSLPLSHPSHFHYPFRRLCAFSVERIRWKAAEIPGVHTTNYSSANERRRSCEPGPEG